MVKVICAGFPKTGTKSLSKALTMLGYSNIYDYLENVDYFFDEYFDVFHNNLNLDRVLDEYEKRNPDAIVDMPPSFFFEEFHKRFPDAKVVLTVREESAWFKSLQKMNNQLLGDYHWYTYFSTTGNKFEIFMRTLYQYMFGSGIENEWLWKMHYRRHNAYVKAVIPPEKLLVLDVKEGWGPLCKFLDVTTPQEEFPFVNAAGTKGNILERLLTETTISRRAKRQVITSICLLGTVTCGAAVGFYIWNKS